MNANDILKPGETLVRVPPSEVIRLRAWEKWGREHAKPVLEWVRDMSPRRTDVERATEALAALPVQQRGGT